MEPAPRLIGDEAGRASAGDHAVVSRSSAPPTCSRTGGVRWSSRTACSPYGSSMTAWSCRGGACSLGGPEGPGQPLPTRSSWARSAHPLDVALAGQVDVDRPRKTPLDGHLEPRQLGVDRTAVLRPDVRAERVQHGPEPPGDLCRPGAVLADLGHAEREVVGPFADRNDRTTTTQSCRRAMARSPWPEIAWMAPACVLRTTRLGSPRRSRDRLSRLPASGWRPSAPNAAASCGPPRRRTPRRRRGAGGGRSGHRLRTCRRRSARRAADRADRDSPRPHAPRLAR